MFIGNNLNLLGREINLDNTQFLYKRTWLITDYRKRNFHSFQTT